MSTKDNLIPLCQKCHKKIENKTNDIIDFNIIDCGLE
jgi:5-methylcytosine-specific restriction endonuclease McrA